MRYSTSFKIFIERMHRFLIKFGPKKPLISLKSLRRIKIAPIGKLDISNRDFLKIFWWVPFLRRQTNLGLEGNRPREPISKRYVYANKHGGVLDVQHTKELHYLLIS